MFQIIKKIILGPSPHLYILRHGHTALNGSSDDSTDRIRGWADVPLTDEGRKDADNARKELLKNDVSPDVIYSSDLGRAMETAQIVNKSFGVKIIPTKSLRPWDLGELTGKETKLALPQMLMYMKAPDHIVPGGESFNEFKKRYLGFLQEVMQELKEDPKTILLVAHFRNVKLAQAWIEEGMKDDLSVNEDVMNKLDADPGSIWELPCK